MEKNRNETENWSTTESREGQDLVQISVELKDSLDQYAKLHSQLGDRTVDAATLIPHMLQSFIDRDRGFRYLRKSQTDSSTV
jgi:hypothetical protein